MKGVLAKVMAVLGLIISLAGASTVLMAVHGHFYTDAEAAEHIQEFRNYQQQQYLADKQDRIDRHRREINRIEYQLLSEDLSPKQREYLNSKKVELRNLIQCIQADRDKC